MPARIASHVVMGVEGQRIDVEADTLGGDFALTIVGLPDAAVRESRERLQSAIKNSLAPLPTGAGRFTINLAPADLPKAGASLDLPMALGLLGAVGRLRPDRLDRYSIVGELALDGRVRPINGALALAQAARRDGFAGIIVPAENGDQAALVEDIDVIRVETLAEASDFLNGAQEIAPHRVDVAALFAGSVDTTTDFQDVIGQESAKRALEIVAAGGHNALLIGPPGAGKTLMLKRLPTILPSMTIDEALETTNIHSIRGLMSARQALIASRPFCAPHHTISHIALVGGGLVPKPGQISLSHNGVLFLDEMPEFPRTVLEALRQPLEDGHVTISRAQLTLRFPAKFILVGSMNPCPCGYLGHYARACTCRPDMIQKYRARLSGPLIDRIDLHIEVPPVEIERLTKEGVGGGESSASVRARVETARRRQLERYRGVPGIYCNAHLTPRALREMVTLEPEAVAKIRQAMEKLGLSARAHDRILRVAQTIADLAGADRVTAAFAAEAINYRTLDRAVT